MCGGPDLLSEARGCPEERFGKLKAQGRLSVHVGMEVAQEQDFSLTQFEEDFAKNLKLLPTFPSLRAGR